MRALVTGASGFIGQDVVHCLLREGVDVVALGRGDGPQRDQVERIHADLLRSDRLDDLLGSVRATLLVHLAWYTEHGAFWSSPLNREWVDATSRLVDAFCRSGGERVLGVGTFAEYEWSEECCREASTPLRPATVYGVAKDAARRATASICESFGVSSAWARIFIPIGTQDAPRRLVPSVIDVLQGAREPFAIDGSAARDFLHVSDIAAGLVAVARSEVVDAINVCAGVPTRIADIVAHLACRLDADPRPLERRFARRQDEPLTLYGDARKVHSLGWRPELSIMDALDRILSSRGLF
jgi:nucleoside-diphosphate-sugar epimerase